jgi:sterol desaturase/sphingolipid hydroxylase (fatty acid hydroxylase superfamily)
MNKFFHPRELILPIGLLATTIWFNQSHFGNDIYKRTDTKTAWNNTLSDVQAILYWGISAFFALMDFWRPTWFHQFKIQPMNHATPKRYLYVTFWVIVNQLMVSLPAGWVVRRWHEVNGGLRPLFPTPPATEVIKHFFICEALFQVLFYSFHVLFHQGALYRTIHKKHHEQTFPYAVSAAYAHPLEHVIVNTIPMLLGPFILKMHWSTNVLWMGYRIIETLSAHSGYDVPFLPNGVFHDVHHSAFVGNYGVNMGFIIMDAIFGTHSPAYLKLLSKV